MSGNCEEARQADLAARVAGALGLSRVTLENLSPGTSRGAVRVLGPAGEPAAFLRVDLGLGDLDGTHLSLADEMQVVRRARALGLPVPEVIAMLDDPATAVMELARGTARPSAEEAEAVGPEYMGHIARLHRADPAEFGLAAPPTITAALLEDIAAHEAEAVRRGIARNPLVRLGLRILRETLPRSEAAPAMLHGDVGAGNFMTEGGKVSAILDWELAHAGDFHEDLAWLWVRGAHTAFGEPGQRLAEYEAAAGRAAEPARLDWQIAFVTLKSVIGLGRRLYGEDEDPGLLPIRIAGLTYDVLFCAALAKLLGLTVADLAEEPEFENTPEARLVQTLRLLDPPGGREAEVLLNHLAADAAQRPWRERRLREDVRARLAAHADDLDGLVDTAPAARLPELLTVVAADAWRRCKALPNAERRVRRALAIGLGQ
ncbi:MAG: phosphotransferase [Sphingomonadales bacterium]|nr:phosphotransferase [Sphingomonadales bacterium]MBU3992866.1 phosphotransferase [Alphaproteobacteria bacterium]